MCVPLLLTQNTSLLRLLVTKCVGVFSQKAILYDSGWVSHNSTHFWHYLPGVNTRAHELSAQAHETVPRAPTPEASRKSQVVTCTSDRSAINSGSHDPLLGFSNLLEWLTELRENLKFTNLLYNKKDVRKGTGEQPDEKIPKKSRRGLSTEGLSLWNWGTSPSWYWCTFTNLEALQIPHYCHSHRGFIT